MSERDLPGLVAEEAKREEDRRRRAENSAKYAKGLTERLNTLIRATVPDPFSVATRRHSIDQDRLSVSYPFTKNDVAVDIEIERHIYPRDNQPFSEPYSIRIGNNPDLYFVSEIGLTYRGQGFDQRDIDSIIQLLDAIELGVESGEIVPIVKSPVTPTDVS